MQVTITADWRSYEPNDPLHSDKEISIAGLSGSVWRDGDDTYGWEVRDGDDHTLDTNDAVVCLDDAIAAVETAIRTLLEEG